MSSIVEFVTNHFEYDEDDVVKDAEETRLRTMIKNSFSSVQINRIEKLKNKYSYASFMLKKEEKNYQVVELIHSTAAINVPSIEENNLDWRRVRRAKYGYGVSFSRDADYANYHSSWAGGDQRAFVICDVLVQNTHLICGTTHADVPPINYDTHQSVNGYVYVKFDDFAFYPKYALYYNKPSDSSSRFHTNKRRFR